MQSRDVKHSEHRQLVEDSGPEAHYAGTRYSKRVLISERTFEVSLISIGHLDVGLPDR